MNKTRKTIIKIIIFAVIGILATVIYFNRFYPPMLNADDIDYADVSISLDIYIPSNIHVSTSEKIKYLTEEEAFFRKERGYTSFIKSPPVTVEIVYTMKSGDIKTRVYKLQATDKVDDELHRFVKVFCD